MRNFFKQSRIARMLALSVSALSFCTLPAEECCPSNRLYIGGFGGGAYSNSVSWSQTGTAFFSEAVGGPLAVDARGRTHKTSSGFGGVQIGYEWTQCPLNIQCSDWSVTPAAELEAFFYRDHKKGSLINPTTRLPEHDFDNSFPMNVGIYLINGVVTLNNCCLGDFSPYLGGGIGPANISIKKAKSLQVSPEELGINHFNSDRNDSTWTFAAQVKAGVRYNLCERFHIFAEYRFLYLNSSRYIFGSTDYPTHVPTSNWDVKAGDIWYNAFALGVQFDV